MSLSQIANVRWRRILRKSGQLTCIESEHFTSKADQAIVALNQSMRFNRLCDARLLTNTWGLYCNNVVENPCPFGQFALWTQDYKYDLKIIDFHISSRCDANCCGNKIQIQRQQTSVNWYRNFPSIRTSSKREWFCIKIKCSKSFTMVALLWRHFGRKYYVTKLGHKRKSTNLWGKKHPKQPPMRLLNSH